MQLATGTNKAGAYPIAPSLCVMDPAAPLQPEADDQAEECERANFLNQFTGQQNALASSLLGHAKVDTVPVQQVR